MSQTDSRERCTGGGWLGRVGTWAAQHRRRRAGRVSLATGATSVELGRATSPLGMTLTPFAGISTDYVWSQFVQLLADDQALRIELDEHQQRQPPDLSDLTPAVTRMVMDDGSGASADVVAWWRMNQEPYLRPSPKSAALCVCLWRNGLHTDAVDVYGKIWHTVHARHREDHRIGWPPDAALEAFRHAAYPHWDNANHEQFCRLFRRRHVDAHVEHGLNQLFG